MRVQRSSAAKAGLAAAGVPAQGLWWNAPANSESGWGINFAHQGDVLFATWFTYDPTGKAWWLSMTANRTGAAPDVYTGALIETRGPAFSAVPFDPALVTRTVVGSATLTFNDVNRGTFSYVVNGVAQTKSDHAPRVRAGAAVHVRHCSPISSTPRTTRTCGGPPAAANPAGASTSRTRET